MSVARLSLHCAQMSEGARRDYYLGRALPGMGSGGGGGGHARLPRRPRDSEEKHFGCPFCGLSYYFKKHLKFHLRQKHGIQPPGYSLHPLGGLHGFQPGGDPGMPGGGYSMQSAEPREHGMQSGRPQEHDMKSDDVGCILSMGGQGTTLKAPGGQGMQTGGPGGQGMQAGGPGGQSRQTGGPGGQGMHAGGPGGQGMQTGGPGAPMQGGPSRHSLGGSPWGENGLDSGWLMAGSRF